MRYRNFIELAVPLASSVRLSMAPILFHGWPNSAFPVVCIESRQAYQALSHLRLENSVKGTSPGFRSRPLREMLCPSDRERDLNEGWPI